MGHTRESPGSCRPHPPGTARPRVPGSLGPPETGVPARTSRVCPEPLLQCVPGGLRAPHFLLSPEPLHPPASHRPRGVGEAVDAAL